MQVVRRDSHVQPESKPAWAQMYFIQHTLVFIFEARIKNNSIYLQLHFAVSNYSIDFAHLAFLLCIFFKFIRFATIQVI